MNDYKDYLAHHGILGMKWGVRRFRSKDGSLTGAGRRRYRSVDDLKYEKTKAQQKSRSKNRNNGEVRKKILKGVAAAALLGGAGYAAYRLGKKHNLPPINDAVNRVQPDRVNVDRVKVDRVEPDRVKVNRVHPNRKTR